MVTYLLTWNPHRSEWDRLPDNVAAVQRREEVPFNWSTGNTRRIVSGDRLFFLKQGEGTRGIFAAGVATSGVEEKEHYDDGRREAGDLALYVNGVFETLLDPFKEEILTLELLEQRIRGVYWTPAASGFSVPDDAAGRLEAAWAEHVARVRGQPFIVGEKYTRKDIYRVMNVPADRQKGDWNTGYHQYEGDWFLFPTVGGAGRTGHDYGNRWLGDDLEWFGDNGSTLRHRTTQSLVSGEHRVFIFTRPDSRQAFVFEGLGTVKAMYDETPVRVIWQFNEVIEGAAGTLAEEVRQPTLFVEGATRQVTVNAYERNRAARRACIDAHGTRCTVCGFDFGEQYGPLGEGFIHVHHLELLAARAAEYVLDAVRDLVPVCANCHAMMHRRNPPLLVDELRACLKR